MFYAPYVMNEVYVHLSQFSNLQCTVMTTLGYSVLMIFAVAECRTLLNGNGHYNGLGIGFSDL